MSNAEKMTNKMFRRSLILKIIVGVIVLFIVACFAIHLYDESPDRSFRGKFDLGEGMEETLKDLGPSTKTLTSFEVPYEDGFNKALIRIRSNSIAYDIENALRKKEDGAPSRLLYEYPDIDAYMYKVISGYVTREETLWYSLFGRNIPQGYWRTLFERGDIDINNLEPPKYRYYILLEIQKESEDNCYWIYAEMNHPEFANDVMKEAVRQINAYVEPDEQT